MERRKKPGAAGSGNGVRCFLALLVLAAGILGMCTVCYGKEPEADAVYGRDIKDGSYEAEVESSSSMFRVVRAWLNVEQGRMTADITLSGTGYLKLFMGTGKEAPEAGEDRYIPYAEDENGAYTYCIPVEALNVEFSCAAYSKRRETWYDRELVIRSSVLPQDAFRAEAGEPAVLDMEDGEYRIDVSLKGGTGRAFVVSPALVRVSEGAAMAVVEWSSPDFDYMVLDGETYLPVNSGGNSVFEIPVLALDEEIDVIADTVAMSSPHEIPYTLVFHGDTMRRSGGGRWKLAGVLVLAAAVSGCAFGYWHRCKRIVKDTNRGGDGSDGE